jgi:hypothetical protein
MARSLDAVRAFVLGGLRAVVAARQSASRQILFKFDPVPLERLRKYGHSLGHDEVFGNKTLWLTTFQLAIEGVQARVWAVETHVPQMFMPQGVLEHEYLLASAIFGMESAMECFVFALNALGNAKDPAAFLDVTSDKALQPVGPGNIIGSGNQVRPGYARYFPSLSAHWCANTIFIRFLVDQQAASKHRMATVGGGASDSSIPAGDLAALNMIQFSRINLLLKPKEPLLTADPHEPVIDFEVLLRHWSTFIHESIVLAVNDAVANIKPLST